MLDTFIKDMKGMVVEEVTVEGELAKKKEKSKEGEVPQEDEEAEKEEAEI